MGICTTVKCAKSDTVGDLAKLVALQTGTDHQKIRFQRGHKALNVNVTLQDYEIGNESSIDLYHR